MKPQTSTRLFLKLLGVPLGLGSGVLGAGGVSNPPVLLRADISPSVRTESASLHMQSASLNADLAFVHAQPASGESNVASLVASSKAGATPVEFQTAGSVALDSSGVAASGATGLVGGSGSKDAAPPEEAVPVRDADSPEELILALSRCFKPDWAAKFRAPAAVALKSRTQTALLAGSVFADGYLAAQAEDPQQCRNVGRDLMGLAKSLGVHNELMDRSRSLAESAQKRDWLFLRRELGTTQSDLVGGLRRHNDEGLVPLVSLGAWMRGEEIVASLLSEHYHEAASALLRQPALSRLLDEGLNPAGEKLRSDSFLASIREKLGAVAHLLEGPPHSAMSREDVIALAAALASIFQDINSR